jgi:colanic acid/amylovoran biosynthesis glycosyltransferase
MIAEQDKLKVLHFVESWLPKTQTWLFNHVTLLPEAVESHVVCRWTENLAHFPAKHLHSLNAPLRATGPFQRVLRRLGLWSDEDVHLPMLEQVIRAEQPSILHSHFGNCGWINACLARKYDLRHIVSFYGLDLSYLPEVDPRWRSRYRQMSDLVDRVLCEGPHMARCIAALGVDPAKIEVFRLGIDTTRIPFVPRQNPRNRTKRFLIAGSFREKKGIPFALEALGLFARVCPDLEITVIGDSTGSAREEREKQKILDVVERNGLRARLRFLGYQPHEVLIREFYEHDVFLSPSVTAADGDTEGGAPVTIIEAAASGMPVVSTTHCDIPFVLSDRNTPYLVAERDAAALSTAIQSLLNDQNWKPLLVANRKLIEQELSLNRQAEKLADIYRALLGNAVPEQVTAVC